MAYYENEKKQGWSNSGKNIYNFVKYCESHRFLHRGVQYKFDLWVVVFLWKKQNDYSNIASTNSADQLTSPPTYPRYQNISLLIIILRMMTLLFIFRYIFFFLVILLCKSISNVSFSNFIIQKKIRYFSLLLYHIVLQTLCTLICNEQVS